MNTTGMQEDMVRLFEMMKLELHEQTATITKNVTEGIMRTIDEKLQPILEENKCLKTEIQKLNEKVRHLEDKNKKNNLILHGIKETEKNHQELLNTIKETLKNLDINIDNYEINNYYRLGRKQDEKKVRPILITFTSFQKKITILKNKMKMSKHTYITEDFSKETMELRKNLQEKLKQEKQNGKDAFIRNNKIVIRETSDTEKRKRENSTSPDNIHFGGSKKIIAPPKLHKTNAFEYMRARLSPTQQHQQVSGDNNKNIVAPAKLQRTDPFACMRSRSHSLTETTKPKA